MVDVGTGYYVRKVRGSRSGLCGVDGDGERGTRGGGWGTGTGDWGMGTGEGGFGACGTWWSVGRGGPRSAKCAERSWSRSIRRIAELG